MAAVDTPAEQTSSGTSNTPGSQMTDDVTHPSPPTWDVNLGIVALNKPTYLGSDRDGVSVGPFGRIAWHDTVSLDNEGLKIYWHQDNFRCGVGLTYDAGRKDRDQNSFFSNGDERLKGMDEISPAVGFNAFTSYQIGPLALGLSATRFDGKENEGTLVNVDIGAPLHPTLRLTIIPRLSAVWANRDYMETFFGVTTAEAADSRFHQFTANYGLRNVAAGVAVAYSFNEHWGFGGRLTVTRFAGDAAKSPLTLSDVSTQLILGFGYHY